MKALLVLLVSSAVAAAPTMRDGRTGHTATLLSDGRVLVIGGHGGHGEFGTNVASAEIWSPKLRRFTQTGALRFTRMDHTATRLADGRVLVIGGAAGIQYRGIAELWDPRTGKFRDAGKLITARSDHQATLLDDGRVLVTGGTNKNEIADAELWDPKTETFAAAGAAFKPRSGHTATLLADGSVLVAGGSLLAGDIDIAERWRPDCSCFAFVHPLHVGRSLHTATRLGDGRVVVMGGFSAIWKRRRDGGSTLVHDGLTDSIEVFDPATNEWTDGGRLSAPRMTHEAVLLADGSVAIIAGQLDAPTKTVEIWDPKTRAVTAAKSLATARHGFTAVALANGVLAIGGEGALDDPDFLRTVEVWSPR